MASLRLHILITNCCPTMQCDQAADTAERLYLLPVQLVHNSGSATIQLWQLHPLHPSVSAVLPAHSSALTAHSSALNAALTVLPSLLCPWCSALTALLSLLCSHCSALTALPSLPCPHCPALSSLHGPQHSRAARRSWTSSAAWTDEKRTCLPAQRHAIFVNTPCKPAVEACFGQREQTSSLLLQSSFRCLKCAAACIHGNKP